MADPYVFEQVAARNNMSPMRFMNQSEDCKMAMFRDYVTAKGIAQQAQRLSEQGLSGEALPITRNQLDTISASQRASIRDNISALHQGKVAKTGFSSVESLEVNTSTPQLVNDANNAISGQLDSTDKNSIPSRANALDENVSAWASPDKAIERGRFNMMQSVEDTEGHDIADYSSKLVNAVMGGDGTADGGKLTDNMKRKEGAPLPINIEIKKK